MFALGHALSAVSCLLRGNYVRNAEDRPEPEFNERKVPALQLVGKRYSL